jgi:hypothetical protein
MCTWYTTQVHPLGSGNCIRALRAGNVFLLFYCRDGRVVRAMFGSPYIVPLTAGMGRVWSSTLRCCSV